LTNSIYQHILVSSLKKESNTVVGRGFAQYR
jgi:hypothetical protein